LPTAHRLIVANGSVIPLEGDTKVRFKIAGKEQTVLAVVTKVVHEFILGIDFLTEFGCQ